MRYRANARVISPGGKELGRVTYTLKAKNLSAALSKIRQILKAKNRKPKKNLDMHRDRTGLHPIRASFGYSRSKAGEGKYGARVRAKRTTRKARRGRQAIS